jgi:transposase
MTLTERAARLSQAEIVALLRHNQELVQQTADLQRQVEWFKRQLFGRKSEQRFREPTAQQLPLTGLLAMPADPVDTPPPPTETVRAYQRRMRHGVPDNLADESGLRFDASVPVEVIPVPNPELAGLRPEDYEVIGEKITYRLAQRPGAYVILKYVRTIIKRRETSTLSCPPAPPAVLERSFADVSVLAGLLVDKLRYHLPLYRQHQR